MQFAKYLANVLPMVFTVIVALFPSVGVVTLTTIMLIPKILIDAFDQTKEIVDACAPHAGEAVAVGVQMAGCAFTKGGKALNAAKPRIGGRSSTWERVRQNWDCKRKRVCW